MKPRHESTPDGNDSNNNITSSDVQRVANPLTVVHGYTELLQRRIRRGRTISDDDMLRILGLMEKATRSLREGLAVLVARLRSRDRD